MAAATDFFSDTSQFDVARKRASDQSSANLQANKDALARRFANLGNLDSGARIKLEQQAQDSEAKNLEGANENINAAQNQELQRRSEIKQGQEYQSGEAEKQRQFATGERTSGQDFASQMADKQMAFTGGENQKSRDQQQSQFGQQLDLSKLQLTNQKFAQDNQIALQWQSLLQAHDQFDKTFNEEQRINNANLQTAHDANKPSKSWDVSWWFPKDPAGQIGSWWN